MIKVERNTKNFKELYITSGDEDHPGCRVCFALGPLRIIADLPQIIKPFAIRHKADTWDAATIKRMGRDWWEESHPRKFGVYLFENHFVVLLGPQTNDSITTKTWSCFVPWMDWRFVRHSWYGPTGEHVETLWESSSREVRRAQSDWRYEFEKTLAKVRFKLKDYDGEEIEVATHIEEREWRFGTKWCSWLSLFRRPMIRRSLDLEFSRETGPRKGSWKGGTLGHSINMFPGELHEAAFRRYCAEHNMTFVEAI